MLWSHLLRQWLCHWQYWLCQQFWIVSHVVSLRSVLWNSQFYLLRLLSQGVLKMLLRDLHLGRCPLRNERKSQERNTRRSLFPRSPSRAQVIISVHKILSKRRAGSGSCSWASLANMTPTVFPQTQHPNCKMQLTGSTTPTDRGTQHSLWSEAR